MNEKVVIHPRSSGVKVGSTRFKMKSYGLDFVKDSDHHLAHLSSQDQANDLGVICCNGKETHAS